MNSTIRGILAIIGGLLIGSVVNGLTLNLGTMMIPLPEGADVSNIEGLKASMHLFDLQNFIPPFLAHALGTLAGAFIASVIAASHNFKFAMAIGFLFLLGGITAVFLVGGPIWFIVLDLVGAYLPMAFLGWKLSFKEN